MVVDPKWVCVRERNVWGGEGAQFCKTRQDPNWRCLAWDSKQRDVVGTGGLRGRDLLRQFVHCPCLAVESGHESVVVEGIDAGKAGLFLSQAWRTFGAITSCIPQLQACL